MFENIEKLIQDDYNLYIEQERYGSGLFLSIEPTSSHGTGIFATPIAFLIDIATSPGDCDAMDAYDILNKFIDLYPALPCVMARNIELGLKELDKKVELWLQTDDIKKEKIIDKLKNSVVDRYPYF